MTRHVDSAHPHAQPCEAKQINCIGPRGGLLQARKHLARCIAVWRATGILQHATHCAQHVVASSARQASSSVSSRGASSSTGRLCVRMVAPMKQAAPFLHPRCWPDRLAEPRPWCEQPLSGLRSPRRSRGPKLSGERMKCVAVREARQRPVAGAQLQWSSSFARVTVTFNVARAESMALRWFCSGSPSGNRLPPGVRGVARP